MIWTLFMMAFDAIKPLTAYFQMRIRKAGGEDHPDSMVSGLIPEHSGYVCLKAVSAPPFSCTGNMNLTTWCRQRVNESEDVLSQSLQTFVMLLTQNESAAGSCTSLGKRCSGGG